MKLFDIWKCLISEGCPHFVKCYVYTSEPQETIEQLIITVILGFMITYVFIFFPYWELNLEPSNSQARTVPLNSSCPYVFNFCLTLLSSKLFYFVIYMCFYPPRYLLKIWIEQWFQLMPVSLSSIFDISNFFLYKGKQIHGSVISY